MILENLEGYMELFHEILSSRPVWFNIIFWGGRQMVDMELLFVM